MHCSNQFIQSFMVYIAVYRQQQSGYVAHLAYCRMGRVSLIWGHIHWCVALPIHQTLAPRLKKVYSYNSTPTYGHYYNFYCETYILTATKMRILCLLLNLVDRFGCYQCADCQYIRWGGTWEVRYSVFKKLLLYRTVGTDISCSGTLWLLSVC